MIYQFVRFITEEEGATAIEYGLMASLIAGVIVGTVTSIGGTLSNLFTTVANSF